MAMTPVTIILFGASVYFLYSSVLGDFILSTSMGMGLSITLKAGGGSLGCRGELWLSGQGICS